MSFSNFEIADIIFKSLKGDLSTREQKILDNWLKLSEENVVSYKRFASKENYVNKKEFYKEFENYKDFAYIRRYIHRKRTFQYINYFISTAAAVVLCCLGWYFMEKEVNVTIPKPTLIVQKIKPGKAVAILETAEGKTINLDGNIAEVTEKENAIAISKGNTISYKKQQPSQKQQGKEVFNTLKIPRGGEYQLELSDGTKVWLNSETMIRYPIQFLKKERIVYVSGEAFFEVSPNKKKPFIIKSGETSIKVLGTSFNFRAYDDESYIQTTLVSGKVGINRNGKTTELRPSEQYNYDKNTGTSGVKKVDVSLFTSWKNGTFVFKSQKLEYILNEIARWYNVNFIYEDAVLKNYVFSGRLRKYDDATPLLKFFEETGGITFENKNRKIYVQKNSVK